MKTVDSILKKTFTAGLTALALFLIQPPAPVIASSHMDAPLITLDPSANTTDVYAFVTERDGVKYLATALAVYPFEEPGIGPNDYRFDDHVLYEIHVCTSNRLRGAKGTDLALGKATFSYQFAFTTQFRNRGTILQAYTGVVTNVGDVAQNLVQRYTVTKVDNRFSNGPRRTRILGRGIVPPNNQGNATPFYNLGDNGENPAKPGVTNLTELDVYTTAGITNLTNGYRAFAGQRDDGFYADIQAIFDLLKLRNPGKDSQGGFNVHTIALEIPLTELANGTNSDQQVVGVYATTSRRSVSVLRDARSFTLANLRGGTAFGEGRNDRSSLESGRLVQVGRQGNPLFCEALVALADKDLYNRSQPTLDSTLFSKYARSPELASLLNALVGTSAITTNRTDLEAIFIPDVIKVDLSTGPARLAGAEGFNRLSVFGGDTLISSIQAGLPLPGVPTGTLPGGWPNGRRFGDDVVDIAVTAILSDLRGPVILVPATGDNVNENDQTYNLVFPYAATPQNGRTHTHPQ